MTAPPLTLRPETAYAADVGADQTPILTNDAAAASSRVPRSLLGIGVTGHRLERLGVENVPQLRDAVAALLAQLDGAARAAGAENLRLITGLAEGADSIIAEDAARRHWQVDVVLPFSRSEFAEDFTAGPARAAHMAQLAAAHAVLELPGHRDGEGAAEVAYERAGRIVLAQSDLLIAVWDGKPKRGRGGAAQIVAEAVLQNIPVIHLDPRGLMPPTLLWDGLTVHELGQQSVETVARGDLSALPRLIADLLSLPTAPEQRDILRRFETAARPRWTAAIAYPALLAAVGVRRPRWSDLRRRSAHDERNRTMEICSPRGDFSGRLRTVLIPRFAHADADATHIAQIFRSGYVTNFSFAAIAVVLSLLGLALPTSAKPVLIAGELVTIGVILFLTRVGNRAGWHRRWLDNRALAERLRCLAISVQLGDLDLRAPIGTASAWVDWYARATARELGLPATRIDAAYLGCVKRDLLHMIDGQLDYLTADVRRMHHLEHRLHMLGTLLFASTAITCIALLLFKAADSMTHSMEAMVHPLSIGATIISAALPAIGAAIYGIRMQGDFAGNAERGEQLSQRLRSLRTVIEEDELTFDTLSRRARRAADLMTESVASWLQIYHARPLALPG